MKLYLVAISGPKVIDKHLPSQLPSSYLYTLVIDFVYIWGRLSASFR